MLRNLMLALALILAPALSACVTTPADVADRTLLDEKAGITIETAYTAAARAGTLAIRAGILSQAQIRQLADLDRRAYAMVLRSRQAYAAGNAASYDQAVREADALIRGMIGLMGER